MIILEIRCMELDLSGHRELRVVVTYGNELIGVGSVAGLGKSAVTLFQVFVAEKWRRKHVGKMLVEKAVAEARHAGALAVSAIVEEDGPLGFWTRLGYTPVHYEGGRVIVTKRL